MHILKEGAVHLQTGGLQMFFWVSEVKENTEITRRGWMIVCFKKFEKYLYTPLSSSLIYSSFLVWFKWLKTWCVHQLELYKTSLYSRGKDATIKDFKLEILICFNSAIVEH
jgi:hypothetical protein